MKLVFLLCLALYALNIPSLANINQVENKHKVEKQKMEQEPSSTLYGGARSGDLDSEKKRDDEQMRRDLEKQKRLYEYEDRYRRGL